MTREQKIEWMAIWAAKNGFQLQLEGFVGFGRECVGVSAFDAYPDYHWYNEETREEDDNGDVWTPEDAYHKHTCVAVLGRGEAAEAQLYEWLRWFDANNFKLEVVSYVGQRTFSAAQVMNGQHRSVRLVRQQSA